ncbi:G protein-coupled receptor, partial [Oryctes borbonicus]
VNSREAVAVVVAFFICWAPFHAQRLIATYVKAPADGNTNDSIPLKIYEISTYISGILYYVSTTINPLLYNIMSNKFREAFKETFARCCLVPKRRHRGPLQRSYSVLSRSTQRRPESSDSGRDDPSQHTHTILIRRNSLDGNNGAITNEGRRSLNKKSPEKSGSLDSDREAVTFTWIANRSDVEMTMASKIDFENIQPGTRLVAVHVSSLPPTKLNKFLRFFRCIAKKTLLDENRRLSSYYMTSISPANKGDKSTIELESSPNKYDSYSFTSGEISNSSLKKVDQALLQDELAIYINATLK